MRKRVRKSYCRFRRIPNWQVLISRGLIVGSDGSPKRTIRVTPGAGGGAQGDGSAVGAGSVSEAIDMVAAVIAFNNLTLEEAYSAFDQDGDGVLSVGDFRKSCMTLHLEVTQVRNPPSHHPEGGIRRSAWRMCVWRERER
jgi:hypothetical protein